MIRPLSTTFVLTFLALAAFPAGCGDDSKSGSSTRSGLDSGRGLEHVGQACTSASECFPGVKEGSAVLGEPRCLDRVEGGYCTHLCTADTDCCAVPGECLTTLAQACGPFESTGLMMCFLSCEEEDIRKSPEDVAYLTADGGTIDGNVFCAARAGTDFICRSTGGGSANRKVCVPGGGSPAVEDGGTTEGGKPPKK